MLFQYQGRTCEEKNTSELIDKGYLANQTLIKFTMAWSNVWTVEKIIPNVSPENELRGEATTSLKQAQLALDDFRKILNDKKCLIWDRLELLSLLLAFLTQTVALYLSRYKK
jgi:hypothetical protein